MKRPLMGMAAMLAVTCSVLGQETPSTSAIHENSSNAALAFEDTSAARVSLFPVPVVDANYPRSFPASSDPFAPTAAAEPLPPAPAAGPSAPAPKPRLFFGDRDDYRWQLGVGVELFRFQSSLINATLVGTITTLTYFMNSWFGVEGNFVTGFAPEIYDHEHVKIFNGAGGVRIGTRRARFEPWGHVLIGGSHLQPQTAGNSKNALEVQAGIGLDYRIYSRLSLRAETDWVHTRYFNENQDNFQGAVGAVIHF